MYKPPQKKNSDWTPPRVQKKGKSPSKLGRFSIQPQPNSTPSPLQEIGEYSRDSADRLAANVMRSLEAKGEEQTETSTGKRQSESSKISVADIVGAPGDPYEQEADQVAAQVMSMPASSNKAAPVQRLIETNPHQIWQRAQSIKPVVQRQTDLAQKIAPVESQLVQRQGGNAACHGTNRRAGIEHETIQQDYIATKDPTGVREYSIPGGSASGRVGYADLVGLGTHAIYEIKPYNPNNIVAGLAQVNGYLQAAQSNCDPNAPWHLGVAYPDTILPLGSNRELVAKQYNNPGLILYYTRKRRRRVPPPEPVPVPVPIPERERSTDSQRERSPQPVPTPAPVPEPAPAINWENVFQVVIGLGLSIATVAVILYALLSPEPASKLAAAGLSVAMITIILSHFGIEDSNNQA